MNTIRAVDIKGGFRAAFGYDRHLRGFVTGLHRRGVAIRLDESPWVKDRQSAASWTDPFFEQFSRPVGARVVLQSQLPHLTVDSPGQAVVNLTTFEASRIPEKWVTAARQNDLTVVNTEAAEQAWLRSGAPLDRLRVCPLGVDIDAYRPGVEPFRIGLADGRWVEQFRTRFLNVSTVIHRKNLVGLMRAWLRATTPDDDAILVLKSSLYSHGEYQHHLDSLEQMQDEVGKRFDDAAPIRVIYRTYPDREMPRLFAAATHYISLSHGEGWDLPMTEAAATGLRLIAPDHSAYQTYLDHSSARLIPSREVPVDFPYTGPIARLFDGLSWWEPDEEAAITAIRDAIAERDTPPTSARDRMVRDFTWDQATTRMIEILTEAEALAPARRWWPALQEYIGRTEAEWRSRRVAPATRRPR